MFRSWLRQRQITTQGQTFTLIQVRQMLFQELDEEDRYDGIWACASLLHLNREELRQVFAGMENSLRKEGLLYASFKYGKEEGLRNGRYFTDFVCP